MADTRGREWQAWYKALSGTHTRNKGRWEWREAWQHAYALGTALLAADAPQDRLFIVDEDFIVKNEEQKDRRV